MKVRREALRLAMALAIVACLASSARAVGDYDDSQSHPLRLVAYAMHPVGYLAEWLVMRPLHRIVSQDDMAPIFGYVPHTGFDYETYQEGLSTGVSYEVPQGVTHKAYHQ
jgi:hypothetical protein